MPPSAPASAPVPARATGRGVVLAAAQALVGAGVLAGLFRAFGPGSVGSALGVIGPGTVVLALLAGLVATAAQAQRWRLVARARGVPLPYGEAVRECWAAGLVNLLAPGGLAGDLVRVLRRRRRGDDWPGAGGPVVGERLAGTSVLLTAGTVPALSVSGWLAAVLAAAALAVGAVAWRATRNCPARDRAAVWGLSVVVWAAYQGLFLVAALRTAPGAGLADLWGISVLGLAGMSVPLGVGGWGPREGVTTLAAAAHGLPAETGFAISLGYGLLALVSAAPGALVLLGWLRPGGGGGGQGGRTHPSGPGGCVA